MIDLPQASEAVRDPLVVAFGLFVLGVLASDFFFRRHPMGRAGVRVIFLIFLTIVLLHADVVPYQPLQLTGSPLRDAVHAILKIVWWLWAAWFLVGVVRALIVFQRRPREAKLLQDLLAGVIYLAALFAIISNVLDLPIQGLLATSGVVAIILGLALQSTLGDVFSGIVLNFSQPYRPGDWISIEGGTEGRVLELNWRATSILTGRRDLAIVPNSTIAKSRIVNVSSPSGIHGMSVTVQLDAKAPPSRGSEILEHAIRNSRLIVGSPPPTIVIKSINAAYTEFEIAFFVENLGSSVKAQNAADAAVRAGVPGLLRPPLDALRRDVANLADAVKRLNSFLKDKEIELVAIFDDFTSEERAAIAAKLVVRLYNEGETLVEPGVVLQSLFIVGNGVLSFTREEVEGEIELLRIGPGEHFGEIGLLTGAAATARISALTATTVYELAKGNLTPVLEARPEVAHALGRALARRQAAGALSVSAEVDGSVPQHRLTEWFMERLRRLHEVVGVK